MGHTTYPFLFIDISLKRIHVFWLLIFPIYSLVHHSVVLCFLVLTQLFIQSTNMYVMPVYARHLSKGRHDKDAVTPRSRCVSSLLPEFWARGQSLFCALVVGPCLPQVTVRALTWLLTGIAVGLSIMDLQCLKEAGAP